MNRIIDVSKARIPSVKIPIDNGGGTANVGDVLATKTFDSESGLLQVGTMVNHSGSYQGASMTRSASPTPGIIDVEPFAGYWDGATYGGITDPNFIAANLINGMSYFGLVGTGANAKRKATGSGTSSGAGVFSVSGLSFTPNQIVITLTGTSKKITFLTGDTYNNELIDVSSTCHPLTTNWAVSAGAFSCADTANANSTFTWSAYE